jgi:uncharacterized membrane protein YjfL (UPF0719 family)
MEILILIQSGVAFLTGIVSLFLMYRLLHAYLQRVFKLEAMNSAYATFKAGVLLSTAMLMSSVIGPGINAIRFLNQAGVSSGSISSSVGYVLIFMLIGMVFSFMVIAAGIVVLFQLTRVNEWEEIRRNNVPAAIISAALILGLAFIMKDHVASVCEMLIPYPAVMQIR